jgi:hypothetical protein
MRKRYPSDVTDDGGVATTRVVSSSAEQQGDSQQSVFSAPVPSGDSVVEVVARILSAVAAARRHAL